MLESNGWVLGVDLGVSSLGLALVDPKSHQIIHTTVRVFPAGMEGDFASGKEESRAKKRREARLARRQTERRKERQQKVFRILQANGFFPEGKPTDVLKALDEQLAEKYPPHPGVPYTLRSQAVERGMETQEVGRALYHLAQRRGFLSNRKAPQKDDKDAGIVKAGIASLWEQMAGRTLGQFFASLDPLDPKGKRIRERYTERKMFIQEFEAIWAAQAQHHPQMTPEFRAELHHAMFHQRPLKDQSDKIGRCIYCPDQPRASAYELVAQHWRLLDKVNNLKLVVNEVTDIPLTQEQRNKIVAALTKVESMTYDKLATEVLGLKRRTKFSIQRGGEKKILGNVTWVRFSGALNLRWEQMPRNEQEELVRLWSENDADEEYRKALEATGKFSEEEIERLADVTLPETKMNLSLKAMRRLIPRMEAGENQRVALEKEFPEAFRPVEPKAFLPPVLESLPELRNPAVVRPLTELRKAVNEMIRRYGKPERIQIELARDLKRSRKDRMDDVKRNRDNEARRQRAIDALVPHDPKPSRDLVEKYLLWEECGHVCPYSGKSISLESLVRAGEFEVEHIIPRSRSLDNSFSNKTLCWREFNAVKRKRTPWEAFGHTEDWDAMVERVKKFQPFSRAKLKRFQMEETETEALLEQFSTNQLNDTRYMSKLAGKYLGLLYGGIDDASGTKRVYACAGQLTAFLRRLWDLDRILNDVPMKSREDHRHHAVDAATVAMAGQGMIQQLARAVDMAEEAHLRFKTFQEPWDGFREQLREQICQRTVVSHRPERKLSGALHEETLYGRPHEENGKAIAHIRKPVAEAAKDIESIVDATVRRAVEAKLREFGGEYKKLENDPPMLRTKKGANIPIRKVRVKVAKTTVSIGKGARMRNVVTGDNHHMAVFEIQRRGKATYVGDVVSRLEAAERHRKGIPVVKKDRGPDAQFLFTLSMGDMVRWKDQLWRVRGVKMSGVIEISRATDARLKADITKSGGLEATTIGSFCRSGLCKVEVSRWGDIRESHD